MIIITSCPQNSGLNSGGGHSYVLRADKAPFSLGWQSSRDDVSIKIPKSVYPKIH